MPFTRDYLKGLNNETLNQYVIDLFNEIGDKTNFTTHQTDVLYRLHNYIYPDRTEYNKTCPPCVKRTYDRVYIYYEKIK